MVPHIHVILLSVPGLRPQDVSAESAPTLHRWATQGAAARIAPTFPCVTSPVQASMLTGTPPGKHGVIANGFYHRERHEVEFWIGRNNLIAGPQIWDVLKQRRPELTSAVWHAQNIKDAAADFIVTPAPIHAPDGSTKLWCFSKPDGLYEQLIGSEPVGAASRPRPARVEPAFAAPDQAGRGPEAVGTADRGLEAAPTGLGHFPLQFYWGPLSAIGSTKWNLAAAQWLIARHDPNFHYIYLPHLDYAAQKFGPDSPQAAAAVRELDAALAEFDAFVQNAPLADDVVILVASEYALTPVSGAVHPNRMLREAGLLKTRHATDGEVIDFATSSAFALVDHQLAHVYSQPQAIDAVAKLFDGVEGVAGVFAGSRRAEVGLDHPRSGEVVLVSQHERWFAYYWWLDDAAAPLFARTVDIHRKPGYDPVELFFDPATKGIPLNAALVKGSHGAPVAGPQQHGALIASRRDAGIEPGRVYRDVDVFDVVLSALGAR